MQRYFYFLAFLLFSSPASAALQVTHQELAPAHVQEILKLFPESKEVPPRLLDFRTDPNIHLFQEAQIFVTFIHEGAALRNSFGYFLYEDADEDGDISAEEILSKEIIFPDVHASPEDGKVNTGDTVNLGKFPKGTHLGFFLIADGARQEQGTFYTLDPLNLDGKRHLAMLVAPDGENIALGIEDLPWEKSDKDFNDILFTFTTEPKSALQEIIEAGNIPCVSKTVSPSPVPVPETDAPPLVAGNASFDEPAPAVAGAPGLLLEGGGRFGCSLGNQGKSEAPVGFGFWALALLASAIPLIRAQRPRD